LQLGMIGLGRMGANMTTRLIRGGHQVVAYDHDPAAVQRSIGDGATGASSLAEFIGKLAAPRAVWIMVPAGDPTDSTIGELLGLLQPGDVIIDGGNSRWTDSKQRYLRCKDKGVAFVDAGTSGGVWGLENGYCLMVGGDADAVKRVEPIFLTLAPPGGYAHVGPSGAGHFSKMVHNGIEYGMLAAYGEGFEILEKSEYKFDLHQLASIWRYGSVVRSWLLELLEIALKGDPELAKVKGWVADSGEGRWTVQAALDEDVPAPVITASLMSRFVSRQEESFSAKIIAALRNEFGGHPVKSE
jgi:6-phosphogluconate dehydrogenase